MNSAPSQDLTPVLSGRWCIGCGACTAADSNLSLELSTANRIYEPDGAGNDAAHAVCPAVKVDYAGLHAWRFPGREVSAHGVVDSVLLAQSVDRDRNLKASSGGLIKELLLGLLARPDIDGAIVLAAQGGIAFAPVLVRDAAAIDALPGSIYHSVPYGDTFKLLRENAGRFVVVGIPCQLEGLYSYIRQQAPELAPRVAFTVGIICGWLYTHRALDAMRAFKGVDSPITAIAYRGDGPVGPLAIDCEDGTRLRVNRRTDLDYMVAFDRSFNINRCHVCVNHVNWLADIAVGDAWLARTAATTSGVSIVIARSAQGTALLDALAADGRLRTAPASVEDIVESQSRGLVFGDAAYAYRDVLRAQGRFVPDLEGPNRARAELAPLASVAAFDRELAIKARLQAAGAYRQLWLRKLLRDGWSYGLRFISKRWRRALRRSSGGARDLPDGFL